MHIDYTPKDVARFWAKVQNNEDQTACWLWIGSISRGHGYLYWHNRLEQAHRLSFMLAYGSFDESAEVKHSCDNHHCVNPQHLYLHNPTDEERFWSLVDKAGDTDACWLWKGTLNKPGGYGRVSWHGKRARAHRVAYLLTYGELPDHLEVCHTCDNPPCCNPKHLFLATHQQNMDDRERKGRGSAQRRGDESPRHKWTEAQLDDICRRFNSGETTAKMLMEEFGISETHLYRSSKQRGRP